MSNLACRARQLSQHHDQFHADHIWSYPYGIIKSVIATITTIWLLRPKAVSKQLLSNQGKPMPIWGQDLDRRFVVIYRSPWSRSGWVWQIWQDSSSRGQTEIQVPSTNYEILNQNFKSQPMNWLTSFPKKKYCTLAIVIWQKNNMIISCHTCKLQWNIRRPGKGCLTVTHSAAEGAAFCQIPPSSLRCKNLSKEQN